MSANFLVVVDAVKETLRPMTFDAPTAMPADADWLLKTGVSAPRVRARPLEATNWRSPELAAVEPAAVTMSPLPTVMLGDWITRLYALPLACLVETRTPSRTVMAPVLAMVPPAPVMRSRKSVPPMSAWTTDALVIVSLVAVYAPPSTLYWRTPLTERRATSSWEPTLPWNSTLVLAAEKMAVTDGRVRSSRRSTLSGLPRPGRRRSFRDAAAGRKLRSHETNGVPSDDDCSAMGGALGRGPVLGRRRASRRPLGTGRPRPRGIYRGRRKNCEKGM